MRAGGEKNVSRCTRVRVACAAPLDGPAHSPDEMAYVGIAQSATRADTSRNIVGVCQSRVVERRSLSSRARRASGRQPPAVCTAVHIGTCPAAVSHSRTERLARAQTRKGDLRRPAQKQPPLDHTRDLQRCSPLRSYLLSAHRRMRTTGSSEWRVQAAYRRKPTHAAAARRDCSL